MRNMKIDTVELRIKRTSSIDLSIEDNDICVPDIAKQIFCYMIGDVNVEHAALLSLDIADRVINYSTISIGGISSVRVLISQVFRCALLSNAAKIIVAHNHPSGILKITDEDIDITKKMAYIARLFDIEFVDSIIVSGNDAISIRDHCKEFCHE